MSYEDPEGYDAFMGRWSARLAPRFLDFVGLGRNDHIADIGCGTGQLSAAVAERASGARIRGLDPSPPFVARAARRLAGAAAEFVVGDGQALPYGAREFDACLSFLVLQGVPDAERMLAEKCRVTRPGGWVAGAVWDFGAAMPLFGLLRAAVDDVDPAAARRRAPRRFATRAEFVALWTRAGLREIESAALEVTAAYENFEDFWRSYLVGATPTTAVVTAMAPDRRDRIAAHMRQALDLADDGQPFTLDATAWAVKGRPPLP